MEDTIRHAPLPRRTRSCAVPKGSRGVLACCWVLLGARKCCRCSSCGRRRQWGRLHTRIVEKSAERARGARRLWEGEGLVTCAQLRAGRRGLGRHGLPTAPSADLPPPPTACAVRPLPALSPTHNRVSDILLAVSTETSRTAYVVRTPVSPRGTRLRGYSSPSAH